jgi:hypothetical protein
MSKLNEAKKLNELIKKNPEKKNAVVTKRTLTLLKNPEFISLNLYVDEKILDVKPVGPSCSINPLSKAIKVVKYPKL